MSDRFGHSTGVTAVTTSLPGAAALLVTMSVLAAILLTGPAGAGGLPREAAPPALPTLPPFGVVLPYPEGCAAYGLSKRHCAYIVDWAREQAGYDTQADVGFELLGDPDCPDGTATCNPNRTQAFVVRVRVTGPEGAWSDHSVFCGVGGQYSLLCTETPAIDLRLPLSSGYHDTPCSGEAGDDNAADVCATPIPPPDPDALAHAVPLLVDRLTIPIDHDGPYQVLLGQATLPNGILSDATLALTDPAPANVQVSADGMTLQLTSLDGGPPFISAYEHGWHPGVERVEAHLSFAVESFEPGAVIEVTHILVR